MSNSAQIVARRSVACYFCNEFLEEKYLAEHINYCGAVLEECLHKCGVYVPRKNMEGHVKSCVRNTSTTSWTRDAQNSVWREKVHSILTLLRKNIRDEEKERKHFQDILFKDVTFLHSAQEEALDRLRINVMETLEEINRANVSLQRRLNDVELTCNNMKQRTTLNFHKISEELQLLQHGLGNGQEKFDQISNKWSKELKDLKIFVAKESILVSDIWQEQLRRIHDLKLELETRCKDTNELTRKQEHVLERIDTLIKETRENSEILTEQQKNTKALKFQVKENLKYVEELIKDELNLKSLNELDCKCCLENHRPFSTNGRFLWRIDRYKEKMNSAKEDNVVLYSPIFNNKEYGYTLRMELFLNGRGQWKNRHIIGCLRVESGKWDPLLDWPCILKAVVILRDQENPANDVKKIVKTVRRNENDSENPDKESEMYMFIPHTTLTRYSGYTRNNVVFLDIRVKDTEINNSTTILNL